MRVILIVGIILLTMAYLLNSPVLHLVYPKVDMVGHSYDRESYEQYKGFAMNRDKVYECMFFLFFLLIFKQSEGIVRAIAAGMLIFVGGSVVDKVFFNISDYLPSDYILGVVAIGRTIYIYSCSIK